MEGQELKEVQEYLSSKGFFVTVQALLEEQVRLSTDFQPGVSLSRSVDDPSRLQDGYNMLRTWVDGSLEQYKDELLRVLYPVFAQCFYDLIKGQHTVEARIFFHSFFGDHELAHSRDLHEMKRVLSSHSEEMYLAQSLRKEKFRVELCEYSYELLFGFLHKERALLMLEIINESIIFDVSAQQPSYISGDTSVLLFPSNLDFCPYLPLNRETVAEMIRTGSASALVGISALNLIASKLDDCHNASFATALILYSLPYTYLPFGLVTVALGVGATKNHRLLGLASSFFLAQILCIFIIGGLRSAACGDQKIMRYNGARLAVSFWIASHCMLILLSWGFMSESPKWLHRCVRGFIVGCMKFPGRIIACWRRDVQADSTSEPDLEASSRSKNQ